MSALIPAPEGALSDADIRRVHDRDACLPDMVGGKDLWPDILGFARAIERAALAAQPHPAPAAIRLTKRDPAECPDGHAEWIVWVDGSPVSAITTRADQTARVAPEYPAEGALTDEDKTRALNLAYQFRSHPASRGIDDIEQAGEIILSLLAALDQRQQAVEPPNLALAEALEEYWDAAWQEGRDDRRHDTEDGRAQKALTAVYSAIYAAQPNVQPKGTPFLARDVAELLGIGVPELSAALVSLGFPQRSQGMTIEPLEALAVCRNQAPAVPHGPEPLTEARIEELRKEWVGKNTGHLYALGFARAVESALGIGSKPPVHGTGGA